MLVTQLKCSKQPPGVGGWVGRAVVTCFDRLKPQNRRSHSPTGAWLKDKLTSPLPDLCSLFFLLVSGFKGEGR